MDIEFDFNAPVRVRVHVSVTSYLCLTIYADGWGTKFGMIKCKTTDIPKFQNYVY